MNTFDEYMRAVEDGQFPEEPRVPAGMPFDNDNGRIINMAFGKFGGLAIIDSKPKSIRSNHYHRTDYHFLHVVAGSVHYYWRPAGSKEEPRVEIFRGCETFFTPPMMEHAVYSPRGSKLISLSRLSRRPKTHEEDLVLAPLIKLEGDSIVTCR